MTQWFFYDGISKRYLGPYAKRAELRTPLTRLLAELPAGSTVLVTPMEQVEDELDHTLGEFCDKLILMKASTWPPHLHLYELWRQTGATPYAFGAASQIDEWCNAEAPRGDDSSLPRECLPTPAPPPRDIVLVARRVLGVIPANQSTTYLREKLEEFVRSVELTAPEAQRRPWGELSRILMASPFRIELPWMKRAGEIIRGEA